ncbi:hypothetical protein EK21DRAFT_112683 [Setomelanomma holmii]|uniref:ADP-ribose 1''-phosphate phosphatase n=1 Tax=Setomelanomma holmii TaxID=210430 RepID=A0A9P4LMF9_9PLEO|nr:hypothetical protein EK21DRAFT_112683 [Setomelanomma holmii]
MTSQGNKSITSYFEATGETKGKERKATSKSERMISASTSHTSRPKPQPKGKLKRPISSPPPAPASKRPNTKATASSSQRKHYAYNDLPSNWLDSTVGTSSESDEANAKSLLLTYHKGDMFEGAPTHSLLIHACNTQGHWGAGIAKAFKAQYSKAYIAHNKFCAKEHSKANPVPTGTSQLLAPVDEDPKHWIGCLFTSAKYGKAKEKPVAILQNTVTSMKMLLELVNMADEEEDRVTEIRMCKINSGMFGVPWEKTEEALQSIVLQEGWRTTIEVWEP